MNTRQIVNLLLVIGLIFSLISCSSKESKHSAVTQFELLDVENNPNIENTRFVINYCFDFLNEYFAKKPKNVKIYFYQTQKKFQEDLTQIMGTNDRTKNFYEKSGGAPRPRDNTFLIPNGMSKFSICHEISHLFIFENYPHFKLPNHIWFEEGLSEYLTHLAHRIPSPPRYLVIFKQLNLIPASLSRNHYQWHEQFRTIESKKNIYLQSYLIIDSLVEKLGRDNFFELIAHSNKDSFENNFKRAVGLYPEEYHQQFIIDLHLQAAAYYAIQRKLTPHYRMP